MGSFVAMFAILSGAFSVAIARFLTIALGGNDMDELKRLYSMALIMQSGLGLLVCLLVATVGSYYVLHVMVMSDARRLAALVVLGFSAVSFFVGLINVPYNALIIAHERMQVFAYMGLVEAGLKLAVAMVLLIGTIDRLILYGLLTLISSILIRFIYARYCHRHFAECRFSWGFDKTIFQRMLSFIGWAFLGNGAVVLREQAVKFEDTSPVWRFGRWPYSRL